MLTTDHPFIELSQIEQLDPNNNPAHLKILSQLQGNILAGYDCDYTVYVCLKFKAQQVETTKTWIRNFATEKLTSAQQQWEIAAQINHPLANNLFTNFLLSGQGYIYLGLKTAEEIAWGVNTFWEMFFRDGLKNNPLLHDPPPQAWEPR